MTGGRPAEAERLSREEDVDLGRRSFFRSLGRSAVTAAGQVVGAADAIRRGSTAAAEELFQLGVADPASSAERLAAASPAQIAPSARPSPAVARTPLSPHRSVLARTPGEAATHRSPFRLDGDLLFVLDQRALPGRVEEIAVREGRDLARIVRSGVVRGGPLLGQLAAYGVALTASRHRGRRPGAQRMEMSAAEGLLRGARPAAHPIVAALDRMARRRAALGDDPATDVLADALRAEADTIANEAMHDHAALARHGAVVLSRSPDKPMNVLLHGSVGALSNGLVGTGLGILHLLAGDGITVHAWVAAGAPTMEGARATSWELGQADLAHTVVPDAALGWLLQRQSIDAVLLGVEWLAANGDAAVLAGGTAIATLARVGRERGAPHRTQVLLCAPLSCYDPGTLDGGAIPDDRRSRQEIPSELVAAWGATTAGPAVDVVAAAVLDGIVTEEGVLAPDDPSALRAAARARDERRDPAVRTLD